MEPDDLSFIEISGEDDSLLPLQHISNDHVSTLNKTYFACSPLQIPRSACAVNPPPLVSPIVGIAGNGDAGKLDLSSNRDSVNKENTSLIKPEVPKLNMEPQSMKRKKQGGYNLRKSLAWHKAFFTEEGILDPIELSMISSNSGNSSGAMLSAIEEDGSESLADDSENLFKELPANFLSEERKSNGAFLPKNGSPSRVSVASASAGKRKVLSAHDVNRSGSKRSGCPRPVAPSSLKRPANANTTKSTNKESKVSRVPARKLDTSVHSATAKNNIPVASNMKRNQISQPAVSIQKNIGSKAASNSIKSARSDARSGSTGRSIAVKSSVQQARRNVTNSSLEKHSSAQSQHPIVNKTKNIFKIDMAPPLPTSVNVLNNHDGDSRKAQSSIPSDGSRQYAQTQTAKPSGLRMPSPSLGFFNQSKAATSHGSLLRINQACNAPESNIPNFRKFDALNATHERLIPAPAKLPDMANGVTPTDTRIPKSIKGPFIPTSLTTVQKVELEVLNNQRNFSLCSDIDQEALPNVGPSENEKVSHVVNDESKSNDNKLLFHRALSDQLKNDDDDEKRVANPTNMDLSRKELENPQFSSHLQPTMQIEGVLKTKDMIDNQYVDEKMCNSLVQNSTTSSELQSGEVISDSINATLKKQDDWLGSVHDINEQSRKQDEATVPCIKQVSTKAQKQCMDNGVPSKGIRSSEFHDCKTAKTADGSREVRLCSGDEAESSHGQPHSEDTVEANDCVASIDNICTKSQGSDVLDRVVVDDMTENVNAANGSELTSSGALCLISPAIKDCGFHMIEIVDCPHGDDTISGFTDTQLSRDILHSLTNCGESEIIGKGQSINMATTTIAEGSKVCLNSGDFSRCEFDLQHSETQPSAVLQTGNGVGMNDIVAAIEVQSGYVINDPNKQKGVESKQNNLCSNSELQPADGISFCQHSASVVNNDQLSAMRIVQSMEYNPSPMVSDKLVTEDDSSYFQCNTSMTHNDQLSSMHIFCHQSVEGVLKASDGTLSEDGMPFEESRESYAGKVTDISLDVKSCSGRELESPHDKFQHKHAEQGNEEIAAFDNKIKKSLVEDEQIQDLEASLLADSCTSEFNPAVADDVYEQSRVHSKLRTLNDKFTVKNCSSEEYEDNNVCGNLMDDVLEQSDACANESNSFIIYAQVATAVRKDGIDENEKADCPSEEDGDVQNIGNNLLKSDVLPEEASISQNNGSSNCEIKHGFKSPIFATEDATMSSVEGVFQDIESILKSDVLPGDAETSISQKNGDPNCEMQSELEDALCPTEELDGTESLGKSGIDEKQDNLVIKPPLHAAPFSDEWLAAFEAAGEEILTMKGGAVQHSPPDKSLPEPGPWSPVKRKNNQGVGPYDCTKFTNGNINIAPSNSA